MARVFITVTLTISDTFLRDQSFKWITISPVQISLGQKDWEIKALKKLRPNVFRFFKGFITFFIMIENSSIDSYQLVNRMHLLISNRFLVAVYILILYMLQSITANNSLYEERLNQTFQSTPTVMLVVYWSNIHLFGDSYNQFTTSKKGSTRFQEE